MQHLRRFALFFFRFLLLHVQNNHIQLNLLMVTMATIYDVMYIGYATEREETSVSV